MNIRTMVLDSTGIEGYLMMHYIEEVSFKVVGILRGVDGYFFVHCSLGCSGQFKSL